MKKLSTAFAFILCWTIVSIAPSAAQDLQIVGNRAHQIRQELLDVHTNKVFVVAHRADWRNFPENSIGAIRSAMAMGVDILELDVQRTKDGVLVLMHDATLDRTTSGKGRVDEIEYEDLKKLRLRNGAGVVTREHIPTLEETLSEVKGKVLVNLDKADRFFDEIYPLLEQTGTTDHILMKGAKSVQAVKEEFGAYLGDVLYMPIVNIDQKEAFDRIDELYAELKPIAFELTYKDTTHAAARQIRPVLKGKSHIWYNSLWATLSGGLDDDRAVENPEKIYGYLIDELGASIIQTDRPALLIEFLKSRELR
ncbi:MAG: glycerophosphodiester phosphodiesterase family protein [Sphingobacterium sp.]